MLTLAAHRDHPVLASLRDLPRRRAGDGPVVCEGAEAVRWLLRSRLAVDCVVGKPTMLAALAADIAARHRPPLRFTGTRAELAALVGFAFDRGVLACARRPGPVAVDVAPAGTRLVACDGVHDPANLGALIRTARCLGVAGVVLGPGCADPWYRRSVRASVGHVFHLPLYRSADLAAWLAEGAGGRRRLAAHRGPLSRPLRAADGSEPWVLVLGNEDRGVRPAVVTACDAALAIPLAEGTDSLNVAVAGGICLHHLLAPTRAPA